MNTWQPQQLVRPDPQNRVALGVLIALAVVGAALALLTALDRRDTRDETTLVNAVSELHDARVELKASVDELRTATAILQASARTLERRATTVNILDVVPPPPPAPPLPPAVNPGVGCSEAGRCTVSRAELERLVSDPAHLNRQMRIMPVQDGQPRGLKLHGIGPDSLPRALGLQDGDLLTAVNGKPLHDPELALIAYSALRDARVLDFTIVRKGEPMALTLTIE